MRALLKKISLRPFVIAIAASLILGSFAGCGPQEPGPLREPGDKYGGVLNVALTAYPPSMDPYTGWMQMAAIVYNHVAELLVTYDEDWSLMPLLAQDYYNNEEYTEWTLELREGVLFHNGSEMTAEDVKASIQRFIDTSPRASDLTTLSDMQIVNDYEIKLIMSEPTPLLPVYLAYPMAGVYILPAEVLANVEGPTLSPHEVVGTGPFVLEEANPDRYVKLTKFEDYSADLRFDSATGFGGNRTVYVDEVRLIPVPDASARTAGILAGDYHFAQDITKGDYDTLVDASDVDVIVNPTAWWPLIYIRNRGDAIFTDLKIRQAVQAACDMEEIMLAAAQREEFYRLDGSWFFQESIWHYDAGKELGLYNMNDPDRARQLLDEAGYDGEPIKLIANTDYDWMYRVAVVLTEQLKNAGFNVELEVYDWPTAINLRNQTEEWDLFVSGDAFAHDGTYMNYWHTDQDWLGFSDPRIDEILDEGMKYSDFETRYDIYCELGRVLHEEAIFIKFGDLAELHSIVDEIEGYSNYYHPRFWDVWITD